MTRDVKILPAVKSSPVLIGICDSFVPARCVDEFDILGVELKVQIREAVIKIPSHTIGPLPALCTRGVVLLGQGVDVAEGEERCQQKLLFRRSGQHLVADQDLIGVRSEKDRFREHGASDFVNHLGSRISLEIDDVLVSPGLIDVAIAVDTQIELLAIQHDTLVHRGEKKVRFASELVNRNGQKTMITPCVASDYGSVAIGSGLVGVDNLPFQ